MLAGICGAGENSMHTYFALKAFKQWQKINRRRFLHPPHITRVGRRGFSARFAGIDQRISCSVDKKGGVTVGVRYGGELWDIIAEFDVIPVRDQSGNYSCLLCRAVNPFPESYSSRLELVIRHAWEPFLDWLNSTSSPSNWICLHGKVDWYSVATVKAEHEIVMERLKDDFCDSFPVIYGDNE